MAVSHVKTTLLLVTVFCVLIKSSSGQYYYARRTIEKSDAITLLLQQALQLEDDGENYLALVDQLSNLSLSAKLLHSDITPQFAEARRMSITDSKKREKTIAQLRYFLKIVIVVIEKIINKVIQRIENNLPLM